MWENKWACDKKRGSDGCKGTPKFNWTDITGLERDPVQVTFFVVIKAIKASSQFEGIRSTWFSGRKAW